jgi:tungstate transport system ATP-binding protein
MNGALGYQLKGVRRSYGDSFQLDIPDLTVPAGDIVCLLGPTGSGKSTLLRLLAGLESAGSGSLHCGENLLNGRRLPLPVQRRITMVFQRPLALAGSVRWNVEYGLRVRRVQQRAQKASEILQRLHLSELASRSAQTLSGGQVQLLALARALVLEPDVLLLDEPTANLDPARVALVEEVITATRAQRKTTVVWATHNLFQAKRVASRVALLLDGRLIEEAATESFFGCPRDPRTRAFIEGRIPY